MGCKLSPVFLVFLIVSLVFSGYQIREVKAPSTFGETDESGASSTLYGANGRIYGSKFTGGAGEATKISVYTRTSTNPQDMKCAIHKVSDKSLVAETSLTSITTTPGWFDFTFAVNPTLEAVDYWLSMWLNDEHYYYFFADVGKGGYQTIAYDGYPNPLVPIALDKRVCIYCTYTPSGQDLSFSLFENFNVWASTTKAIETSNTFYQNFNVWDSLSFNKEVGIPPLFEDFNVYSSIAFNKEIGFKLYEPFNLWSYLATNKEQAFTFYEAFNLWSSITMASEGVALDLYFTLFEGFNAWPSLGAVVAEEITLDDVYGLAALAFIMAIVGICLAVAFKKK